MTNEPITSDTAPAPTQATPPETLRFDYVPRPGLLGITLVNLVLNLLTFTIYRFWAKTRVRRHIWSCIHINGEPLEYTGRGMELFKGFLVVFGLLVLPFILLITAITFIQGPESPLLFKLQTIAVLLIYVFWGYALYSARRYQLSRTLWRGIRGTLVGSPMTYSLTYFGSLLASGMTLGWATPVMNTVLQEQIVNAMRFGDAAFKFKGPAGPLYPAYALAWLSTLGLVIGAIVFASVYSVGLFTDELRQAFEAVFGEAASQTATSDQMWIVWRTIGQAIAGIVVFFLAISVLWSIYTAKELRTFANYTRFDGAQFHLKATTLSIVGLSLGNLALLIITLGIAMPFIQQRTVRYAIDRLALEGAIDVDRIRQSQAAIPSRGEGLADAFDVGGL
jgi:uncharacterized membrane protein YjgN (DUF898 family)